MLRLFLRSDWNSTYASGMNTHTVAAIYARISRDKLAGTERESESVEGQVRTCREWIEARGWTVGEIYTDNSISATSGAVRPGFEQMLEDAPPIVVYRHQDRLERSPVDLTRFLMAGCQGYGTDGSKAAEDSAAEWFATHMRSLMAAHEQKIKSERQRSASMNRALAGKYRGSIRPFGQERGGTWVPAEAEAVRTATRDLLSGDATFYSIARRWNDAGLLPPKTGKQGGREWTAGTVVNFFKRPRLMGFQAYGDELYELKEWTPLLSPEEFERMQSIIKSRATGTRKGGTTRHDVRLLTGILKCGVCGRGMNTAYRGGAGTRRAYRCPTGAGHVSITAEPVEETVKRRTLLMLSQRRAGDVDVSQDRLEILRHEKRVKIADHEAWEEEAAEAGLRPTFLAKRGEAHAEEIAAMDREIGALEVALGIDLMSDYGRGWDDAPMERKRDVLTNLYAEIVIEKGGQGARFHEERLRTVLTPLGREYMKASEDAHAAGEILRRRPPLSIDVTEFPA